MNSDQLMKCRDLSSRSSFLLSSPLFSFPSLSFPFLLFLPLPFYSTFFPLQSLMLHGVLGNYANTALVRDQDTGSVTRLYLETALNTLVHCYQHTSVCCVVFFCLFCFLVFCYSPTASNGYAEFDHAWRLILSSGSKLA